MRFNKRSRNPLLWRRRNKSSEEKDPEFQPVESDEREALLSDSEEEDPAPETEEPVATAESAPAGDPTQQLLTALGRFQRQIARARDGVPQDAWADACMEQLVRAVEIAMDQGWRDVVETLTETARVLQSYAEVGKGQDCVSFLGDSYEILCLMVGDLIVGKVRSGVLEKWRSRHQRALDDMGAAGISLVDDDHGDEDQPLPEPVSFSTNDASETEAVEPLPVPQADTASDLDDLPSLDELASYQDDDTDLAGKEEAPELDEENAASEDTMPDLAAFLDEESSEVDVEATTDSVEPSAPTDLAEAREKLDALDKAVEELIGSMGEDGGDAVDVDETEETNDEAHESLAAEDEEPFAAVVETPDEAAANTDSSRDNLPKDVVEVLDTICDQLSQIADDQVDDISPAVTRIEECLSYLEDSARQESRDAAILPCLAVGRLVRLVGSREAAPDDRFFELAYAFCGIYGEAEESTSQQAIKNWLSECDDLLVSWSAQSTAAASDESAHEPPGALEPLQPLEDEQPTFEVEPSVPLGESEQSLQIEEIDSDSASPAAQENIQPPDMDEIFNVLDPSAAETTPEDTLEPLPPLSDSLAASESAPPSPAAVARDAASPSEALRNLMETANRAIAEGNTANAMLYAMQTAATIAESEAQQAKEALEQSERQLQEGVTSSNDARDAVHTAEEAVQEAEARVEEFSSTVESAQEQTAETTRELEHVEALIKEIDEQIKALERQREETIQRKGAAEAQLDQHQKEYALAEQDLEQRKKAEMEARVALEDARQRVKSLERRQLENQTAMERAREKLDRKRASLSDIEKTIAQICNNETRSKDNDDAESGEMLF